MRLSRLFFYTILFGALGYFSYRAYQTVTRGGNAINAERDYTYQELRQSGTQMKKNTDFYVIPKEKRWLKQ
ncbi:MAG: hypothetical protein A3C55_02305 [Gammaproteobacteria bacterium RIFCSPHIGHO2_02_FULL_42_13]|nr:MAG: hypothetical protein A3C55_02305 [Gammaproteobacteria bacterium RIFCSPHIGHO2_02_FULL_42_13]OGT68388.1 MAG: hypothetical protein A3H43_00840 [Gammaproteobacteria bacterium RIFCSPLOWO2_02_FULL_42_9]